MTAWVLFFAGVTCMRSLTRSRGRVTVVLFMKLSTIRIMINHMLSIRTCQEKKPVLMKGIEKWFPDSQMFFCLKRGRLLDTLKRNRKIRKTITKIWHSKFGRPWKKQGLWPVPAAKFFAEGIGL